MAAILKVLVAYMFHLYSSRMEHVCLIWCLIKEVLGIYREMQCFHSNTGGHLGKWPPFWKFRWLMEFFQKSNTYWACVPKLVLDFTSVGNLSTNTVFPHRHWRPSWKMVAILKLFVTYMLNLFSRPEGTCVPNLVLDWSSIGNVSRNAVFS